MAVSPFSIPNYSTSPPLLISSPLLPKTLHSLPSFRQPLRTPSAINPNNKFHPIPSPNGSPKLSLSLPQKRKSEGHEQNPIESHDGDMGIAHSRLEKLSLPSKSNLGRNISQPKFQMTLAQLLADSRVKPVSVHGDLDLPITGIQHDSREVTPGDLFICRIGSKTDGHMYLNEAIERGASAAVVDKEIGIDKASNLKAAIIVQDTNSVLPLLAATFYRHPSKNLLVIGITGTNGKTTTTHLVKSVSEAVGLETGMLGTLGYYIHGVEDRLEAPNTTPDALVAQKLMAKMVHNGANAVVMEASSHGLALGRCDEIDFDIAVFTNLTRDHLDFHGTEEEYRKSKEKLFAGMIDPEKHRKVVNIDDQNASYFTAQGNCNVPVVTFAMENKDANVKPLEIELTLFRTRVLVSTPKGVVEISSSLVGRYNVYNILAAVAVGIALDAPLDAIARGIEDVVGVPGRCELIREEQAFAVIVDYAHTPDALSRLLDAARELSPQRIITVFGCGGERDRGKRPLMAEIATEKSDVVILTSDNPRNENPLDILDDMLVGVGWSMQNYLRYGKSGCLLANGHRLFVHDIRRVALQAAIAMGTDGDIVIVAGKGHETYQIEGDKKKYFDDREECREALHYIYELRHAGIDTNGFPWQ